MGESKTLDVLHPCRTHDFLAPAESGGREAWTRLSLRPLKLATLHCYQHAVVPRNGPPDEPLGLRNLGSGKSKRWRPADTCLSLRSWVPTTND